MNNNNNSHNNSNSFAANALTIEPAAAKAASNEQLLAHMHGKRLLEPTPSTRLGAATLPNAETKPLKRRRIKRKSEAQREELVGVQPQASSTIELRLQLLADAALLQSFCHA